MKDVISALLSKQTHLKKEDIEKILEVPQNKELGDYAFPCFSLAKEMKKSPVQISADIAGKLKSKEFEKISAVGPYINFFVNRNNLAQETISAILKQRDKYGSSKEGKGKKIVVDFSGPNIGKPMHIGHIRSTIIGDSLTKISSFLGYKPIGINYLGDVGLHVGKIIVAYELWADKKALQKDPIQELLRLYVKFSKEEKSEFQEGQEEDYEGNEWTKKAKEKLKLIENGDKKTLALWKEIEKKSIIGFNRVYDLLNVKFDEVTGQSNFSDEGKALVLKALEKGIAKKEKDSEAVFIEFQDLPKRYVLRSNGTASYITQDMGAAFSRFKKYKFQEMIYVTDYRQQLHFQQLFKILGLLGYQFNKNCKHVPFGTLNFGNEIVATREGKVILLEDVLNKATIRAKEEIERRNTTGDASKIALSAIKYLILRSEPIKDISFTWDSVLSFEGNTGPYLLYGYARARSILSKAKYKPKKFKINNINELDKQLVVEMSKFPSIVEESFKHLSPNLIANYSFQLSQKFNEFYHSNKVIGSDEEQFRLSLVDAFSIVLKNSLSLLGINVLEKM